MLLNPFMTDKTMIVYSGFATTITLIMLFSTSFCKSLTKPSFIKFQNTINTNKLIILNNSKNDPSMVEFITHEVFFFQIKTNYLEFKYITIILHYIAPVN